MFLARAQVPNDVRDDHQVLPPRNFSIPPQMFAAARPPSAAKPTRSTSAFRLRRSLGLLKEVRGGRGAIPAHKKRSSSRQRRPRTRQRVHTDTLRHHSPLFRPRADRDTPRPFTVESWIATLKSKDKDADTRADLDPASSATDSGDDIQDSSSHASSEDSSDGDEDDVAGADPGLVADNRTQVAITGRKKRRGRFHQELWDTVPGDAVVAFKRPSVFPPRMDSLLGQKLHARLHHHMERSGRTFDALKDSLERRLSHRPTSRAGADHHMTDHSSTASQQESELFEYLSIPAYDMQSGRQFHVVVPVGSGAPRDADVFVDRSDAGQDKLAHLLSGVLSARRALQRHRQQQKTTSSQQLEEDKQIEELTRRAGSDKLARIASAFGRAQAEVTTELGVAEHVARPSPSLAPTTSHVHSVLYLLQSACQNLGSLAPYKKELLLSVLDALRPSVLAVPEVVSDSTSPRTEQTGGRSAKNDSSGASPTVRNGVPDYDMGQPAKLPFCTQMEYLRRQDSVLQLKVLQARHMLKQARARLKNLRNNRNRALVHIMFRAWSSYCTARRRQRTLSFLRTQRTQDKQRVARRTGHLGPLRSAFRLWRMWAVLNSKESALKERIGRLVRDYRGLNQALTAKQSDEQALIGHVHALDRALAALKNAEVNNSVNVLSGPGATLLPALVRLAAEQLIAHLIALEELEPECYPLFLILPESVRGQTLAYERTDDKLDMSSLHLLGRQLRKANADELAKLVAEEDRQEIQLYRLLLGPEPGKEQSNDPAAVAQRAVTTAHAMERNLVLWFNFHLGCAFHSPPKKKKRPSSGRRTSRVRRAGSKLSSRSGHGSLADRRMSTGRRKSTARRKSVLMRKPSMKGGKRRKSTYVRRGRHSQMGTGGYHRTTLGSAQYSAKRDTLATPGVESSINSRMRRRASTVSTVSEDAGTTPTSLTLSALTTALAPATHLAAGSKHGSVISMVPETSSQSESSYTPLVCVSQQLKDSKLYLRLLKQLEPSLDLSNVSHHVDWHARAAELLYALGGLSPTLQALPSLVQIDEFLKGNPCTHLQVMAEIFAAKKGIPLQLGQSWFTKQRNEVQSILESWDRMVQENDGVLEHDECHSLSRRLNDIAYVCRVVGQRLKRRRRFNQAFERQLVSFVELLQRSQYKDAISPYSVLGHHQPEHIRLLRVSVMDNPSLVWTFVQLLGRHEAMLELSRLQRVLDRFIGDLWQAFTFYVSESFLERKKRAKKRKKKKKKEPEKEKEKEKQEPTQQGQKSGSGDPVAQVGAVTAAAEHCTTIPEEVPTGDVKVLEEKTEDNEEEEEEEDCIDFTQFCTLFTHLGIAHVDFREQWHPAHKHQHNLTPLRGNIASLSSGRTAHGSGSKPLFFESQWESQRDLMLEDLQSLEERVAATKLTWDQDDDSKATDKCRQLAALRHAFAVPRVSVDVLKGLPRGTPADLAMGVTYDLLDVEEHDLLLLRHDLLSRNNDDDDCQQPALNWAQFVHALVCASLIRYAHTRHATLSSLLQSRTQAQRQRPNSRVPPELGAALSLSDRVRVFLMQDLIPNAQRPSNYHMEHIMSDPRLVRVTLTYQTQLQAIFAYYTQLYPSDSGAAGHQPAVMSLLAFKHMIQDAVLLSVKFTFTEVGHIVSNVFYNKFSLGSTSLAAGTVGRPTGQRPPPEEDPLLLLTYPEFLEALTAVAAYKLANPFLELHSKLDMFLSGHFIPQLDRTTNGKIWG